MLVRIWHIYWSEGRDVLVKRDVVCVGQKGDGRSWSGRDVLGVGQKRQ